MLTHEVVTAPFKLRTYRLIRKILIGFILISIANLLFSNFFYTPKIYRINRANRELTTKYQILQDKMLSAQRKLAEIKHRDNYVYRALFSADTLSIDGIYTSYPDSKYDNMKGNGYTSLMVGTWRQIDAFARQLYLESVSLDELQIMAKNKENMSTAIPAVWPIDRTKLRNGIGAFGMRIHPKTHIYKMHTGVDMACSIGSPVYATGDATVEMIDQGQARYGYGRQILLNHRFGYKTRYAHLNKMFVRPGEKVLRGQLIAEVGNTGGVTGPHLHYEVIFQGRVVNPINYFNKNMTNEEYKNLMENIHETDLETF